MTRPDPHAFLNSRSEMARRIRSFDWANNPLGAIEGWDPSFKKLAQTMLNTNLPQFISWGEEQIITYNDAMIQLLGMSKHPQVLGAKFEVVWAEVWSTLKPLVDSVASGEPLFFQDHPFKLERGGELSDGFFSFSYVPLYDDNNRFSGILCSAIETTAAVLAVREAERARQELSDILESMDEAYFAVDKNWIITSVNFAHEVASKRKREDQLGKNFLDLFLPGEAAKKTTYWSAYHKAMEERISVTFEDYYEPLDLWTLVNIHPRPDGGLVVFFRDINESKKTERDILQSRTVAERANDTKSVFLANMSHEIRTPLGAIMGFADLIAQPRTSRDEIDEYVSVIKRNSVQLLRIIDDILDLSKVEAGRMEIEHICFNLLEVLSDISSLLGLRARENSIHFEMQAATPLPDLIIADSARLRQILINVVGNAIKFTEKGSVKLIVSFHDNLLTMKVKDSGRGISPEQSRKLFQPFTQADAATNRKFGGTGLGLVLTRSLCRAMGGDFYLEESELAKGSTFVASVRGQVAAQASSVQSLHINFSTREAVHEADSAVLDGTKILVVEDSPDNQVLLQIILTKAGAKVDIAKDGREGVEMAMRGDHDIVLMDVQMPHMDGLEAVSILRKKGYQQPVVALTAHAMKEQREHSLKAGFSHFMSKPIQKRALLELLELIRSPENASASQPKPSEPSVTSATAAARATSPTRAESRPGASSRILVVEDDEDTRSLLFSLLEGNGYAVSLASSGEEALDYLAKNPMPGLILTDLTLPEMTGEEMVKKLSEHPARSLTKVIVSSGWHDLGSRCKAMGADGFIRKPVDFDKLMSIVAGALAG